MKSSDRIIVWALAISLAIHAVVLTAVHFSRPVEAKEKAPTPAAIRVIVREPPPTPTPPPEKTKPVQPTKPTTPNVRPPVTGPSKPGAGNDKNSKPPTGDGPNIGVTNVAVTAAPIESPKPRCSAPYTAALVTNAIPAESPEEANGAIGKAQVKVDLAATGAVVGVSIYASTGNMILDRAAMRAAHASSYRAETRDCESVSGSYLFTVDFQN
jgi:TonB family protein